MPAHHVLGPGLLEDLGKQGILGLERDGEHILVDGVCGHSFASDLDTSRVVHQVVHVGKHAVVERGGEQQRLAVGGDLRDDLAHLRHEAHVQHAVGLVEYEDLHIAEVAGALVDEVDQAAGSRDEQVGAMAQRVDLRLVADAAYHGRATVLGARGDSVRDILDLVCELARGGHDEHERAAAMTRVAEPVHGRQQEGGRLARAGLGGGEQVATGEDLGNRGRLHGRRLGIAEVVDRGKRRGGKPEACKGDGRGTGMCHAGILLSDGAVCRAVCSGGFNR